MRHHGQIISSSISVASRSRSESPPLSPPPGLKSSPRHFSLKLTDHELFGHRKQHQRHVMAPSPSPFHAASPSPATHHHHQHPQSKTVSLIEDIYVILAIAAALIAAVCIAIDVFFNPPDFSDVARKNVNWTRSFLASVAGTISVVCLLEAVPSLRKASCTKPCIPAVASFCRASALAFAISLIMSKRTTDDRNSRLGDVPIFPPNADDDVDRSLRPKDPFAILPWPPLPPSLTPRPTLPFPSLSPGIGFPPSLSPFPADLPSGVLIPPLPPDLERMFPPILVPRETAMVTAVPKKKSAETSDLMREMPNLRSVARDASPPPQLSPATPPLENSDNQPIVRLSGSELIGDGPPPVKPNRRLLGPGVSVSRRDSDVDIEIFDSQQLRNRGREHSALDYDALAVFSVLGLTTTLLALISLLAGHSTGIHGGGGGISAWRIGEEEEDPQVFQSLCNSKRKYGRDGDMAGGDGDMAGHSSLCRRCVNLLSCRFLRPIKGISLVLVFAALADFGTALAVLTILPGLPHTIVWSNLLIHAPPQSFSIKLFLVCVRGVFAVSKLPVVVSPSSFGSSLVHFGLLTSLVAQIAGLVLGSQTMGLSGNWSELPKFEVWLTSAGFATVDFLLVLLHAAYMSRRREFLRRERFQRFKRMDHHIFDHTNTRKTDTRRARPGCALLDTQVGRLVTQNELLLQERTKTKKKHGRVKSVGGTHRTHTLRESGALDRFASSNARRRAESSSNHRMSRNAVSNESCEDGFRRVVETGDRCLLSGGAHDDRRRRGGRDRDRDAACSKRDVRGENSSHSSSRDRDMPMEERKNVRITTKRETSLREAPESDDEVRIGTDHATLLLQ